MGKLLDLSGKPLIRQEVREMERDIAKNIGKIIPGIFKDLKMLEDNVNALGDRTDIILEVLRILGMTDDQFKEAIDRVKAKCEAQEAGSIAKNKLT
ncbi:MAG: hypothetical protein WC834_08430 [Eubacteriales bacterium]